MSRRNALLVAIVAVIVLAVFLLWPERAAADSAFSGRKGGFAGHDLGGRAHGGGGLRGGIHIGDRGVHGRFSLGAGDFRRHRSFGNGHRRHGLLLGDRFRSDQLRRIDKGYPRGALIGDVYRFEQRRRLNDDFLRPKHNGGRPAYRYRDPDRHDRDWHDRDWPDRNGYGHKRRGDRFGDRHGRHRGKWLGPAALLLPYGGADVIVREVVVPVVIPVPAERPATPSQAASLDPRGRATLVGEKDGVAGDWAEGDILPGDVPHVTLDPVAYDLPQPPSGEKYARVGNDVLRIDALSRRITEVIAR